MIIFFTFLHQNGDSSLQAACIIGNTDIVKVLIQSNADIELVNKVGVLLSITDNYNISYRRDVQD